MSVELYCSLCCSSSSNYKKLQHEVYEITVKYFDPMLITVDESSTFQQENKVLCQNCWVPIKEFHEFQQNVIKARTLLEKPEIKQLTIIKTENEIDLKDVTVNIEDDIDLEHSDNNDEDYGFEVNIKNEIEFLDKDATTSNDEDDEKPLITLKNKETSNKEVPISLNTIADNNIQNINIKVRRGRKRKTIISKEETGIFDESGIQRKKGKLNEEDKLKTGDSKFNLKKARESDDFIREWKPILECDLCEETTSSFDKLRSHFKDKHKSRFYIKCCERKFYRRYVLVNHLQLHLNPDTHKCEICGKVSANKNNLKLHKKLMHEKTEQLECEVCHKLFNLKTSLDRHLLTHVTGEKEFVCQDCGKAYVLEVQLKSHIKTVHNVDRICDQCGKTVSYF